MRQTLYNIQFRKTIKSALVHISAKSRNLDKWGILHLISSATGWVTCSLYCQQVFHFKGRHQNNLYIGTQTSCMCSKFQTTHSWHTSERAKPYLFRFDLKCSNVSSEFENGKTPYQDNWISFGKRRRCQFHHLEPLLLLALLNSLASLMWHDII